MSTQPILIVEDNPDNLKLTQILLELEGYEVRTAQDAEEALITLESCRPALILMDIQLPGMDGLELTRRLRRSPALCDVKIVALTAYAMKGDEENARVAGCDGYIAKPIDTRTFPTVVRGFLQTAGISPPAAGSGRFQPAAPAGLNMHDGDPGSMATGPDGPD
jgi:two-component system, cell cycle response regulator DivK